MRRIAVLPYEGLLLMALMLIAAFPIAGLKGLTLAGIPHIVFQVYLLSVVASYFVWFWQKSGQTLPMKTWRMRIVDRQGRRLSIQKALIRFGCCLFFYGPACVGVVLIFFPQRINFGITIWCFFPMLATILFAMHDQDRQFLHDRIAGTRIEDTREDTRIS